MALNGGRSPSESTPSERRSRPAQNAGSAPVMTMTAGVLAGGDGVAGGLGQGDVHGVASLGPVEHDQGHVAAAFDGHDIGAGVGLLGCWGSGCWGSG